MLGASDGFPFMQVEVRDRMNPHQRGSLMTFPKSERSTNSVRRTAWPRTRSARLGGLAWAWRSPP